MINARVNLGAAHIEANAKEDATLVAEAAVMFLSVARSIVENADDKGLAQFTLGRVANDVAKRIEAGEFDDGDELEKETEAEDKDLDKAIDAIVKKVLDGLKKGDNV